MRDNCCSCSDNHIGHALPCLDWNWMSYESLWGCKWCLHQELYVYAFKLWEFLQFLPKKGKLCVLCFRSY